MTLDPFIRAYINERRSRHEIQENTASRQRCILAGLSQAHGNRTLAQFGLGTINTWLEPYQDGPAGTARLRLSVLRGFCRFLFEEGHIRKDPTVRLKSPRVPVANPRALDADVIHKVFLAAPDERAKAILWLMVGLGLRCIEVARLRVEHWSRMSDTMLIIGKGSDQRELPVTTEVRSALQSYLAVFPSSSGPLIRSYAKAGGRLQSATISEMVVRWMADAGVKGSPFDGISAHALRHTAASDVLEGLTGPEALLTVRDMLGHKSIQTTTIYLRRVKRAKLREAMGGRSYQ